MWQYVKLSKQIRPKVCHSHLIIIWKGVLSDPTSAKVCQLTWHLQRCVSSPDICKGVLSDLTFAKVCQLTCYLQRCTIWPDICKGVSTHLTSAKVCYLTGHLQRCVNSPDIFKGVSTIERKRRGEATSRRAACDSPSMLGVPALLVCCCVFILQSVLVSLIAVERPLHLHSLLSIWCLFIYLTGTSVSLYKASSI